MKLKIKKSIELYYYIIFLSLFIFGNVIRRSFFSGFFGTGNFIFYLFLFIFTIKAVKLKKINFKGILCIFLIIPLILYADFKSGSSIKSIVTSIVYLVFPLLLMDIDIIKRDKRYEFIHCILSILNFFVILNVCIMFLDQISGCMITKAMTTIFPAIREYIPSSFGFLKFRSVTYLGHELYITHLILMFYMMNMLYYKFYSKYLVRISVIYIVTIFGILFTQSKLGVILIFAAIFYFNFNKKNRMINIVLLLLGIVCLYYIGFFDVIIYRFKNTSFDTGRTTWLNYLRNNYGLSIQILGGYGENMNSYFQSRLLSTHSSNWARVIVTAAFESPMLLIAYRYGVLVSILWLSKIYLTTLIPILKSKCFTLVVVFMLLFIHNMSFNQLVYNNDLLICVLIRNIVFLCFVEEWNNKYMKGKLQRE